MMYAFQLSPAQRKVVDHLNGGGYIYAARLDRLSPIRSTIKCHQKTLNWLVKRGVIELGDDGYYHSTALGKTLDDTGWVDPIPRHQKFGNAMNAEKDAIREQLIEQGANPNDPTLIFKISRIYRENHKDDLSYRDRQKEWATQSKRNITKSVNRRVELSPDELEYLQFLLEYSNHPLGQQIYEKIKDRDEEPSL